jgi:SAM-dependent MidA family methyltransferase
MEKENRGREERLKDFILSEIAKGGPVPFSRFMEWCLYHPLYGYYQSEEKRIGKEGDYYTGPCVHPLFGRLIARQLSQMAGFTGGEFFDIIEVGGGRGFLCGDILHWAKERAPDFYGRIRYYLVETAPSFLREQRERLDREEREGKVFWLDLEGLRKRGEWIEGCILSNELFDALPVHRVTVDHGDLKEIYVSQQRGELEERLGVLSDTAVASYLESMEIRLEEGQKAEINLKALEWIEDMARCLRRGFVLTIDYGYSAQELYAPHHREGTLLCYYQHKASKDLYVRLGRQDMTAHVNFTGLIRKGESVGLRFTGLASQHRFLFGAGLAEELEYVEEGKSSMEKLQLRLSLKHLIEPELGMGETFQVLIQHKGIDLPQLNGLREFREIAA